MYEMTLEGLLAVGDSWFVRNKAEYMLVEVVAYDNEPEIIINTKASIKEKLNYYENAYDKDLVLKSNNNIKIINYDFCESIDEILTRYK